MIILNGSLINQQAVLNSTLCYQLLLKYCKGRTSILSRLVGALDDAHFSLSEKTNDIMFSFLSKITAGLKLDMCTKYQRKASMNLNPFYKF